jgi:tetratricopeptide (TPR) repeat protein
MNRRFLPIVLGCLAVSALVPIARPALAGGAVTVTAKSPEAAGAFAAGRDLADNLRITEAQAQYRKAVSLDPDFALATAYLGAITPGAEGDAMIERAVVLSAKLPESERMLVQALAAGRRGDENEVIALRRKLADIAPGDWHVQFDWGQALVGSRKFDEAAAAYQKAVALNPKAGAAYNSLGYAQLAQNRPEEAIAAFKRYAEVNPTEPNPADSLGEALLRAGRFEESEAAFQKALAISPTFFTAWEGIAKARAMRGDWPGSYQAAQKARAAAARPVDQVGLGFDQAWSLFAEGKKTEALKASGQVATEAQAKKLGATHAFIALDDAARLTASGQPADALKQVAVALDRGEKAKLAGGPMTNLRRTALYERIDAESRLGQAEDAKRTLALVEADAAKSPANAQLQSNLHFARGAEAMARGDARAAAGHFAGCIEDDTYCGLRLLQAQEKAGDAPGATATRERLRTANRRDGRYLYVRTQVQK